MGSQFLRRNIFVHGTLIDVLFLIYDFQFKRFAVKRGKHSDIGQKELEQRTFLIKQKRNLRLGYIKNRKGDARFPQPCETVVHFLKA